MTTMTRWPPYMPRLHFHHHHDVNGLFPRFFEEKKDATRNAGYRPLHGRVETGSSIADAIVARTREPGPARWYQGTDARGSKHCVRNGHWA